MFLHRQRAETDGFQELSAFVLLFVDTCQGIKMAETKIRLTIPLESDQQVVLEIPATIRIERIVKPPPKPPPDIPTELLAKYRENAKFGADRMVDFWIPHWIRTDAEGQVGQLQYDGIHMLMVAAEMFGDDRYDSAAIEINEQWVYPILQSQPEIGVPGFFNYNAGLVDIAVDRSALPELYTTAEKHAAASAIQFAMHSPFSRPGTIKRLDWPFSTQEAREIANGLMAHVQLLRLPGYEGKDASRLYIEAASEALLDSHIPHWIDVCGRNDPDEMAAVENNVAPFTMALVGRALIATAECPEQVALIAADIVPRLTELANAIYPLLWRESDRGAGFLYKPGQGDVEVPDLALLIFPLFAWLSKETANSTNLGVELQSKLWKKVASDLFALGVNHGYIQGFKQFNQSFLWSYEGMKWMGWVDEN